MIAVIKTGGKQYIVSPGQKLKLEKIEGKEGTAVIFKEVLLVEKNRKVAIGTPFVRGASVTAKIVSQGKGDKVIVFKYKPKTRQKTKKGHRQQLTEVAIEKIVITPEKDEKKA